MELLGRYLRGGGRSSGRGVAARLAASLLASVSLCATAARAQDATWLLNPGTNDWDTAANWAPGTVPTNTASFGASNTTTLTFSASPNSINAIQFNAGAPAYTFNVAGTLSVNGAGIVNNSANAPTFVLGGTLNFFNSSTAGNAHITNNVSLNFFNSSSAGNATITSNSGLFFNDASTAGNAAITSNAGLTFANSSTAGSAHITSNAALNFFNTSSGDNANITANSGMFFNDASSAGNAIITGDAGLTFLGSSTAGNASITNNVSLNFRNSSTAGNAVITSFSTLFFNDDTSAGNAAITNNNSGLHFVNSSTAGEATITTNSGGTVNFFDASTGGNARFITNSGGTFDISGLSATGMTAGSIEGAGNYFLGLKQLTVGSNGLSTTVSGVISDGGAGGGTGGSLVKVGAGTLTLSGANTYSGGTTIAAGTLQAGGTLGFSSASGFTVAAGATLDLNSFNESIGSLAGAGNVTLGTATLTTGGNGSGPTFSGTISGSGGLVITGGGAFTLAGTNTYTGPTLVSVGALWAGGPGAFSNASAFTVASQAELVLNGFDQTIGSLSGAGEVIMFSATLTTGGNNKDTTFSGTIVGTGSLTKAGSGTLTLSGFNTYSGGTTVEAGALTLTNGSAVGSGPLALLSGTTLNLGGPFTFANKILISGDPAFNIGSGNVDTLSGMIADGATPGTFEKTGAGTLILSAANTYSGPTMITAGLLDVTGSIANSIATIANGATLAGSGTVGGVVVPSGGTLSPGAVTPFTTLNVAGNASFAAGSTFVVNINPTGQTDKLAVTGKTTLSGGTVQVVAAPGLYTQADRYTISTANGGVSGTFAQLTTTTNLAFLTPTLFYDPNDVVLGFPLAMTPGVGPIPFPSVALTRNEASTATAVQALGLGNPVYNAVVGQSVAGARRAFDTLSGEIHASAVTAAFEDQRLPREAIFDRLSRPADTPVLGAATMMTGAYAADLPSSKGLALAPVAVQMYQPRLFGFWGQGFGNWGETDGDHNAAKLSRDTGGFIIGADAERQLFSGDWRFGMAGGYTDDGLKVQDRSSSGDYQSIFGALYGKASYGAIDLKVGAILASTDTHTSRSIVFPGFADAASSNYGGYAAQGFGELGYRLPFHWSIWSYVPGLSGLSVNYEPFLQGAVMHIDQNRYLETALNAGLTGAAQRYDLGLTTLGLRTQYQLASLPGFTLSTLLGWRHAFGDVTPSVSQTFAGSFSSFTVAGVPVDRDAFVSETSLDYRVTGAVTVGVSYSGQYGKRATDNAFKGHVDVSFW